MLFSFIKAKAKIRSQQSKVNKGDLMLPYREVLNFFDKEGLYPDFRILSAGINEPFCVINGKEYLTFCSNNYLSLTEHPEVKQAAIKSIEKYGVGPGGSRAVNGTIDIITELEGRIAELTGTEDCLTFPTGYMANVGVVKALMDSFFMGMPVKTEDSVVFSDEYNHGSIVDGCRVSRAKKVVYKHDSLTDLQLKIRQNNLPNKLIITEGVFSTEGETIDVGAYIELSHSAGAMLLLDDAHGVGVLGEHGGGTPEVGGGLDRPDILMGSMDKAFGGTGGYLCGSKDIIRYLRVATSSSLLSSALPTVAAAAMNQAVKIIMSKEGERKRSALNVNSAYLKNSLSEKDFKVLGDKNLPAVPLLIGDERKALEFSSKLFELGIFTSVFRWPAVPQGKARLRLTLMASHTHEQIDRLVTSCIRVGKELGII